MAGQISWLQYKIAVILIEPVGRNGYNVSTEPSHRIKLDEED